MKNTSLMSMVSLAVCAGLAPYMAGAAGQVQISDVVVPEIFNPYVQQITEQKSRLIASGAVVRDTSIDAFLSGGGSTFTVPSFRDIDNDEENVSSDEQDDRYTGGTSNSKPKKIGTASETGVRLSRNQSWAAADLATTLAGADPMMSIAERAGAYWARRLQVVFISTMKGVFANNDAVPVGTEHVQGDLTNDISGTVYSTATAFSAPAFLDALVTIGDSQEDLGMMMVHSIVYNRMQKNNLIDFIPDATGQVMIPTFLGRTVIVDDSMPGTAGVYETWIFGAGAVRYGAGEAEVPTEIKRDPDAGNGGGAEVMYSRVEWCVHPSGYSFVAAATKGGPVNGATSGGLSNATTWKRVYTERKQVKIARLITREFAVV